MPDKLPVLRVVARDYQELKNADWNWTGGDEFSREKPTEDEVAGLLKDFFAAREDAIFRRFNMDDRKPREDRKNEVRTYDAERNIVLCTSIIGFSRMKNIIVTKKMQEDLNDIRFHVIDCFNKVQIL